MRFFLNILYLCTCISLLWGCNSKPEQSSGPVRTATEDDAGVATVEQEEEQEEERVILFYGNSLTAGYGLDDPSDAFPGLIQEKLDSLGYNYKVVNAGLSGETTSGGLRRIDWVLERQKVDIFVLELGANDGLRGQDQDQIRNNLEEMIDKVRKAYPEARIILAGMMVPPSLGQTYSTNFQKIFPEVAKEKDVELIPFLLQDVAGERELNQGDGIHPTEEGQKILARNVWDVLEDVIKEQRQGS
nr:arylesterase [Cesiribacter sp. SM1]